MEGLLRLLIILLLLVFGGEQQTPLPPDQVQPVPMPTQSTMPVTMSIDSVTAMILESYPAQINLNVTGYHDGCEYPVLVEQRREGNDVYVTVYRDMPLNVMCPAIAIQYNSTIQLDGTFESGMYHIHVNDYVLEITVA